MDCSLFWGVLLASLASLPATIAAMTAAFVAIRTHLVITNGNNGGNRG